MRLNLEFKSSDYNQSRQLISLGILLQFWDVFICWAGNLPLWVIF